MVPPTNLHKHLYEQIGCDQHINRPGPGKDDLRLEYLVNKLKKDFRHEIVGDAIPLKLLD